MIWIGLGLVWFNLDWFNLVWIGLGLGLVFLWLLYLYLYPFLYFSSCLIVVVFQIHNFQSRRYFFAFDLSIYRVFVLLCSVSIRIKSNSIGNYKLEYRPFSPPPLPPPGLDACLLTDLLACYVVGGFVGGGGLRESV